MNDLVSFPTIFGTLFVPIYSTKNLYAYPFATAIANKNFNE